MILDLRGSIRSEEQKRLGREALRRWRAQKAVSAPPGVAHGSARVAYSEDQPRDEQGRWTDEGGVSQTDERGTATKVLVQSPLTTAEWDARGLRSDEERLRAYAGSGATAQATVSAALDSLGVPIVSRQEGTVTDGLLDDARKDMSDLMLRHSYDEAGQTYDSDRAVMLQTTAMADAFRVADETFPGITDQIVRLQFNPDEFSTAMAGVQLSKYGDRDPFLVENYGSQRLAIASQPNREINDEDFSRLAFTATIHEFMHVAAMQVYLATEGNPGDDVMASQIAADAAGRYADVGDTPTTYSEKSEAERIAENGTLALLAPQDQVTDEQRALLDRLRDDYASLVPEERAAGVLVAALDDEGDAIEDEFGPGSSVWRLVFGDDDTARVAYAEDQPREPSGSPEGGRFTKADGGSPTDAKETSKTPAEYRRMLKEAFPHAKITVGRTTTEANTAALHGAVNAATDLAREFPSTASMITGINIGDYRGVSGASTFTAGVYRRSGEVARANITISCSDMNDTTGQPDIAGKTEEGYDRGYAAMAHEFGHAVDFEKTGIAQTAGISGLEAARAAGDTRTSSHLSTYAMTERAEYFAEAFAAAHIGMEDRLTDADRAMLDAVSNRAAAAVVTIDEEAGTVEIIDDFVGSVVMEATGLARRASIRLAYTEDQPRDELGRWTSDGGGEEGESSRPEDEQHLYDTLVKSLPNLDPHAGVVIDRGIDPLTQTQAVFQLTKGLGALAEQYPKTAATITQIAVEADGHGYAGLTDVSTLGGTQIFFEASALAHGTEGNKVETVDPSPAGLIAHEFGHAVHMAAAAAVEGYPTSGGKWNQFSGLYEVFGADRPGHRPGIGDTIEPEAWGAVERLQGNEQYGRSEPISPYAGENIAEAVAEAFAAVRMPEHADDPDVRAVVDTVSGYAEGARTSALPSERGRHPLPDLSDDFVFGDTPDGPVYSRREIEARARSAAARLAYSPDQARDERGRWTDEGGGEDPPLSYVNWNVVHDEFYVAPEPGRVKGNTHADVRRELGKVCRGGVFTDSSGKVDIDEVLSKRGEWFDALTAKGGPGEAGMCHWNAAILHAQDPERYIWCSGVALSMVNDMGGKQGVVGVWMAHSWIEDQKTGRIIETNERRGEPGYAAYYGARLTESETKSMARAMDPPRENADLLDRVAQNHGGVFIATTKFGQPPYPNLNPNSPAGRYATRYDEAVDPWLGRRSKH